MASEKTRAERIAELEEKMFKAGLIEWEIYLVRVVVGLPVSGDVPSRLKKYIVPGEERLGRWLSRALGKIHRLDSIKEEARLAEMNMNPQVLKVIEIVESIGLNHSGPMAGSLVIEGGVKDLVKALKVPGFSESVGFGRKLTDSSELTPEFLSILPGRRVLMRFVVEKLKELGAVLVESDLCHADTVDETHEFIFNGRKVELFLMPR